MKSVRGKNRLLRFSDFALGLVLTFQSIAICLLIFETRIPFPDFVVTPSLEAARKKGVEISFESLKFSLKGMVFGKGVILRSENLKVPVLAKLDRLVVFVNPWSILKGKFVPNGIDIEGGKALFIEEGGTESIFSELNGKVFLTDNNVQGKIDGQFGEAQINLSADADLAKLLPKGKGSGKIPFFKSSVFPEKYTALVEKLSLAKNSLRNCPRAFVSAELKKIGRGHRVSVDAQANKGRSERIRFEQVMAHLELRQQGPDWRIGEKSQFFIQDAGLRERGSVTKAKLHLASTSSTSEHFLGKVDSLLKLEGLRVEGRYDGTFRRVFAEIGIDGEHIHATCLAKSKRLHLGLKSNYNLSSNSGSVQGQGFLFPMDLDSNRFRELDRSNNFRAPEGISLLMAKASIGPGISVSEARMRATSRNLTYRGVQTKSAITTVRYTGDNWLLDPLIVKTKGSLAKGSYSRKSSREYRFLLKGTVQPEEINPWMGNWWSRLWHDFQIFGPALKGDFDVSGRWREPSDRQRQIFGSIQAESIAYRKLPVEQGRVLILGDVNQTTARDLDLDLKHGWAKGFLTWSRGQSPENNGSEETRYSFQGEVKPSDCIEVFGRASRETILKFESKTPISFVAEGITQEDEKSSELYLEANASTPLRYANVPLEELHLKLSRKGRKTNVHDLKLQFAGGVATGALEHQEMDGNPHLEINLHLTGADRARAVQGLQLSKVFATDKDQNESLPENEVPISEKDRGILDFTLLAKGNPTDPLSFNGRGQIDLEDAELGSIRLFGPLSKTLGSSPIPLAGGSVNFTRLASNYTLNGSEALFDEMTVMSSTALIRGKGTWSLKDNSIDFNARMYLIGGISSKIPILGKIADLVDPLSKFLGLELKGSLDDPKWKLTVDPKLPFKE